MAEYAVRLTARALRDLDRIYAYVAEALSEPVTAQRHAERLETAILSLEDFPYRCPERRRGAYAGRGYRELFAENFTVIFRVDEAQKQVIVVTVRYSRSLF